MMYVWQAALVVLYESEQQEGMHSKSILREIQKRQRAEWNVWMSLEGDKPITQLVCDLKYSKGKYYIQQTEPRSGVFRIRQDRWAAAERVVNDLRERLPFFSLRDRKR